VCKYPYGYNTVLQQSPLYYSEFEYCLITGSAAANAYCSGRGYLQQRLLLFTKTRDKGTSHYRTHIWPRNATGFDHRSLRKRFENAAIIYKQFQTAICHRPSAICHCSHAPYSTSLELMQLINAHSAGKVITILTRKQERKNFLYYGESAFRKLLRCLILILVFTSHSAKAACKRIYHI